MTFIWATRGRSWGFRFLRDGGYQDSLPVYEAALAALGDDRESWRQLAAPGSSLDKAVALRFPILRGAKTVRAGSSRASLSSFS